MTSQPALSIGMPVFNAESFLDSTLETVLQQSFGDFELILIDNASTDGTEQLCREHERRDPRVRFIHNRQNVGSRRNYNLSFELARGSLFCWARAHDLWASDYLERCVEVLETDDEVVLCHARCTELDADGVTIGEVDETLDTRGMPLLQRLPAVFRHALGPAAVGVVRSEAMTRTRLFLDRGGCDILFLLELSAHGAFAFIDEPLLSLRKRRTESSEAETIERTRLLMNPFADQIRRPFDTHILEFAREHLQIIDGLQIERDEREQLEADLVACYSTKFLGSFERCGEAISNYVAERFRDRTEPGFDLSYETLRLLELIHLGLLFRPDNTHFCAAHSALLGA